MLDLNNDFENDLNSEGVSEDFDGENLNDAENATQEPEKDLNAEITRLEHELAVARADFYNFRQRALKEKQDTRRNAQEDVILNFLPVLDNLDRALSASNEKTAALSDDTKNILTGVEMVRRQFISTLENFGV